MNTSTMVQRVDYKGTFELRLALIWRPAGYRPIPHPPQKLLMLIAILIIFLSHAFLQLLFHHVFFVLINVIISSSIVRNKQTVFVLLKQHLIVTVKYQLWKCRVGIFIAENMSIFTNCIFKSINMSIKCKKEMECYFYPVIEEMTSASTSKNK